MKCNTSKDIEFLPRGIFRWKWTLYFLVKIIRRLFQAELLAFQVGFGITMSWWCVNWTSCHQNLVPAPKGVVVVWCTLAQIDGLRNRACSQTLGTRFTTFSIFQQVILSEYLTIGANLWIDLIFQLEMNWIASIVGWSHVNRPWRNNEVKRIIVLAPLVLNRFDSKLSTPLDLCGMNMLCCQERYCGMEKWEDQAQYPRDAQCPVKWTFVWSSQLCSGIVLFGAFSNSRVQVKSKAWIFFVDDCIEI